MDFKLRSASVSTASSTLENNAAVTIGHYGLIWAAPCKNGESPLINYHISNKNDVAAFPVLATETEDAMYT